MTDTGLRVLVTRPAAQAREWVESLRSAGLAADALPLIDIAPAEDTDAVAAAWATVAQQALVVFVSPNAVAHFFALRPSGAPWPVSTLAASPGPGTTLALLSHGVPPAQVVAPASDAPHFDSESLWAVLAQHEWAGRQVLIVRGTKGRDWLSRQLSARGAHVGGLVAYRRGAPQLTPDEQQMLERALAQPARHLWLFSSSEAVDHLQALAPGADWSGGSALAGHPRIAKRARQLGIGHVHEARPTLAAVVACIQSIAS